MRAGLDLAALRTRLLALHGDLEAEEENTRENRAPVELDQTSVGRLSRMDAMQVQAMALATSQRRKTELIRIEQALKRLDSGDYGYCAACDEEIAPKRLDLDPAVPLCIDCARGGVDRDG